jgi:PKD repeat protein
MKRFNFISATALIMFCCISLSAQVLLNEDFSNGMPQTFSLTNIDMQTPAQQVNYISSAWVVRPDFNSNNLVAVSTSWYNPAAQADDWMILPQQLIGNNTVLSWRAKAQDAAYPDGYHVLVSTTGNNIADFTDTVFEVTAESALWAQQSISLAAYAGQNIFIAFRNNSYDKFLLMLDDIVLKNRLPADVEAVEVFIPEVSCNLSANESVSVKLKNVGLNPVSNFKVGVFPSGANAFSETFTGTIQPGDSLIYIFINRLDLSDDNEQYDIIAYTALAGDGDLSNDTTPSKSTYHVAISNADDGYYTSFENLNDIIGWSVEDVNNDSSSWTLTDRVSHTGDNSFIYFYNVNNAADDWLFSTCMDMNAAKAYRLVMNHRVGNSQGTVFPEKFSVHLGTQPNKNAMQQLLRNFGTVANDSFVETQIAFKPDVSGTQYLGFRVYSDADRFFLSVDDVELSELLPPVANFTYTVNQNDVTFNAPAAIDPLNTLQWNFGDNATATNNPAVHHYEANGTYNVCLTISNFAGSDSLCKNVTIGPSAIDERKTLSLNIYPNPNSGNVFIILPDGSKYGAKINVYNATGTMVYESIVAENQSEQSLNLNHLPKGVYHVRMNVQDKNYLANITLI